MSEHLMIEFGFVVSFADRIKVLFGAPIYARVTDSPDGPHMQIGLRAEDFTGDFASVGPGTLVEWATEKKRIPVLGRTKKAAQ